MVYDYAKLHSKWWGKIEGEIESSGSKNSSLPILAATILNKGKTVLKMYQIFMIPRLCLIL